MKLKKFTQTITSGKLTTKQLKNKNYFHLKTDPRHTKKAEKN